VVKRELWLGLGLAVITVSPNIVWNATNGFVTLRHAGGNVIGEPIEPSVIRPLEFLAAQFAVFGPVVFGLAVVAIMLLACRAIAHGMALSLLPSPLWGGVGGGGRETRRSIVTTSRPPTPTLPQPKPRIRGFRPLDKVIEIGNSRFRLGGGRRGGSLNTKDNFHFERTIVGFRGRNAVDLRRKR